MGWKFKSKAEMFSRKGSFTTLCLSLLAWIFLLLFLELEVYPYRPHTFLSWVLFVTLGPLAYLFVIVVSEGFGDLLNGLRAPLRQFIKVIAILCFAAMWLWVIHRNITTGE
jgi:hypothetical protein